MPLHVKTPRRTVGIRVYVTAEESQDIAKAAKQNGMSMSELLRIVFYESMRPTPHMDDIKKESTP